MKFNYSFQIFINMNTTSYVIYKITNTINNKCYIGLTSRDFSVRLKEHLTLSNRNTCNTKFHLALRKYSIDLFSIEILEYDIATITEANSREIFYIDKFDSYRNGYNMTKGGFGRTDYYFSDSARQKMSKSKHGTILSDSHKNNIRKSLQGKPKSESHKQSLREANTGKTHTRTTKDKISKARLGLNTGATNPSAIIVYIFDSNNKLRYECHGNFNSVCSDNELPVHALRDSYYKNGKILYPNSKTKKYHGWYSIKIIQ